MTDTVVLAFSGGLDTSWCVPWLRENMNADVITVTVDVGGIAADERQALARRSKSLGAQQHVHVDARERFFDEVLRYLIMGNVLRGELYPLCVGAERGLQAQEVARVARELGATAVAHGCTAAGNDQVRFEVALRVLAPELQILAPIRDLAPSRAEEAAFLEKRQFPVPGSVSSYSINSGLWGVTIGGRETHDTTESLPEHAWVRTRGALEPHNARPPERHQLAFARGIPVSLDGEQLAPVPLIEKLDVLAASFGIGRGIHLGETILGTKGRVAFEAPAATVLISAHRELEKLTLTATQQRMKDHVSRTYGDLVHEGQLLEPACRDAEALLERSQERVTGKVFLQFRTGSLFVEGASSPHSLRDATRSVYGEAPGEWTPEDAKGFSAIRALPAMLHKRGARAEEDAS